MFSSDIKRCVHDAVNSVPFEKVSDLSKEQFEHVLSQAIYSALSSSSTVEHLSNETALRMRRHR